MSYLENGFGTLITFSLNPNVKMREIDVTIPGIEGGEPIEQTTHRNEEARTFAPRSLVTITDGGATVAYDPAVVDEIMAMVNINQQVTYTYPDGATRVVWSYVRSFQQAGMTEGTRPTATVVIPATNRDDNGDEALPVDTPAP